MKFMNFLLNKNTKLIIFFLVLIILLLLFIYLDKNGNNGNKEPFEENSVIFSLVLQGLNKVIKINEVRFLSNDNGVFKDINGEVNVINSEDTSNILLNQEQKQQMGISDLALIFMEFRLKEQVQLLNVVIIKLLLTENIK